MPLQLLDELHALIKSVPYGEYSTHTLSLLRGFAISAIQSPLNPPRSKRWYGINELWELMQVQSFKS